MAWLLSDIRTYLRDNDSEDGGSRAQRNFDRIANDANLALHGAGNWEFDRHKLRMVYPARKTAGTVSVSVDGTAVTGVSTAFASADAGSFFRFSGQDLQYRVSAYVSATALTLGDTYRGRADVSAGTYALTVDRVALDVLFRAFELPFQDYNSLELEPKPLDEILWSRMYEKEVSVPRVCAVEWFTTSTVGVAPAPYLWVYPPPSSKTVLDFYAYLNPVEMSAVGDSISAPQAAEASYRAFLDAFLMKGQGKIQEYTAQLEVAIAMARRDLAQFRARRSAGQKRMWTPEADPVSGGPRKARIRPAAGEPVYE